MPKRNQYLFVCVNRRPDGAPKGSCAQRGSVELHAALKEEVQKRGLAKTEIRACTSSCLDLCEEGPTILVSPQTDVYGRVALTDVAALVDALSQGKRLERLLVKTGVEAPTESTMNVVYSK